MPIEIPGVVIDRLPLYARALNALEEQKRDVVSSQELGSLLAVTPAQIRKDLSYFGRFGKQGRGYNVRRLAEQLRQILGLDRQWSMILIGVGNLGSAILSYDGFLPQGFVIVDAFDSDPRLIGTRMNGVVIRNVNELADYLADRQVDVGIVAVPGNYAQQIVTTLVAGGIHAILNYAPVAIQVPARVQVRHIDPVLALQSMTYYLKTGIPVK